MAVIEPRGETHFPALPPDGDAVLDAVFDQRLDGEWRDVEVRQGVGRFDGVSQAIAKPGLFDLQIVLDDVRLRPQWNQAPRVSVERVAQQ